MSPKILEIEPELRFFSDVCVVLKASRPFQIKFQKNIDFFNKKYNLFTKIKENRKTNIEYFFNPDVFTSEIQITLAYIFVLQTKYNSSHTLAWKQGLPRITKDLSEMDYPIGDYPPDYIQEVIGKLIKIGIGNEHSAFKDIFNPDIIDKEKRFIQEEDRLLDFIIRKQSNFAKKLLNLSTIEKAKEHHNHLQKIHREYSKILEETEGNRQRLRDFLSFEKTETVQNLSFTEFEKLINDCYKDLERVNQSLSYYGYINFKIGHLIDEPEDGPQ